MTGPVRLTGLGLAYPPHRLRQDAVRDLCRGVFADRAALFERMVEVYDNAGIEERRSCVPIDWYRESHGWTERMALYERHALDLLEEAARTALRDAGLEADAVDEIVCVSTTGIATPSLDALLMGRLGLRRDARRLPIFGLGCAGGVNGLARAAAAARAHPGATVLFLVVELCALTFRPREMSKSNIVASALFGDGAAAVVLRAGEAGGVQVGAAAEHTWPDSRDVMGWRVEEDGLGVIFSRDIPSLIARDLAPIVETFLENQGLTAQALGGYVMHAGGTKVLEAYRAALGVDTASLDHAYAVLRNRGNMSSVTVLAVLEKVLASGSRGPHLMAALGPGFTAGLLLLDIGR
jgi:alkylresorcinol/alkylpyrone synthase